MKLEERLVLVVTAIRNKINLMVPRLVPPGGSAEQRLVKASNSDYDLKWVDAGYATTIKRTTVSQSSSVTTVANVTELVAPVVANGVYRVTGRILFQSSGLLVGATIGFNSPAGAVGQMIIAIPTTALISTGTATIRANGSNGSGTTTSVVAVATPMLATVDGILIVAGTPGNFSVQFASSSVLGTVTVLAGSTLVLEKIG